jgi:formylglycine-generating enzyme required for sulfatase activity
MVHRLAHVAVAAIACALAVCCCGCRANSSGTSGRAEAGGDEDANAPVGSPCGGDAGAPSGSGRDSAATDAWASDAGDDASPPNCGAGGPGVTSCGSDGESCCTSLEVEGGTFYRDYPDTSDGGDAESAAASVGGFRLDKYLVTVGRFRQFVEAWNGGAGYLPAAGSGKHVHLNGGRGLANGDDPGTYETAWDAVDWDSQVAPTDCNLGCSNLGAWTPSPGDQENLPLNCANWYEAYAFCIWDGGFLPSDAELEYAGAGGDEQRLYPWGSASVVSSAYAIVQYDYPDGSPDASLWADLWYASVANIAPVGTAAAGVGRWGQLDLVGEVWQWDLDSNGPFFEPCSDCAGLTLVDGPALAVTAAGQWSILPSVDARALRGCSFGSLLSSAADQRVGEPSERSPFDGFRCARVP